MTQLVSQQRPNFLIGELRGDRAVQDDVGFAGYVGQRSVESQRVLCLIDRDRHVEREPPRHVLGRRVDFRLRLAVHPIRRFQQVEPNRLGVFLADLVRGVPPPDVRLFRLQILTDRLVVRQRLQVQSRKGVRTEWHCRT